jgi:hypothetical protein
MQAEAALRATRSSIGVRFQDDPMPLLDEVIAEQSELLALPGGDAVLARAHMVRAELLRMWGDDRSAIAGYTWVIDRFFPARLISSCSNCSRPPGAARPDVRPRDNSR